jgi:hypothetical protein
LGYLEDFYASMRYTETQRSLHLVISSIVARFHLGQSSTLLHHLQQTQALISGSYPLLVLFPDSFEPNDLDIFLPLDSPLSPSPFIHWIEDICGYRNVSTFPNHGYIGFDNYITCVTKHQKLVGGRVTSINIIVVKRRRLFQVIAKFASTITMNFISYAGFCSLYPNLTLDKKGLELYSGRTEWINKYRNRGFDIKISLLAWQDTPTHHCGEYSSCPATSRNIGDLYTLFVPFTGDASTVRQSQMEWLGNMDLDIFRDWQIMRDPCIEYVEFIIL